MNASLTNANLMRVLSLTAVVFVMPGVWPCAMADEEPCPSPAGDCFTVSQFLDATCDDISKQMLCAVVDWSSDDYTGSLSNLICQFDPDVESVEFYYGVTLHQDCYACQMWASQFACPAFFACKSDSSDPNDNHSWQRICYAQICGFAAGNCWSAPGGPPIVYELRFPLGCGGEEITDPNATTCTANTYSFAVNALAPDTYCFEMVGECVNTNFCNNPIRTTFDFDVVDAMMEVVTASRDDSACDCQPARERLEEVATTGTVLNCGRSTTLIKAWIQPEHQRDGRLQYRVETCDAYGGTPPAWPSIGHMDFHDNDEDCGLDGDLSIPFPVGASLDWQRRDVYARLRFLSNVPVNFSTNHCRIVCLAASIGEPDYACTFGTHPYPRVPNAADIGICGDTLVEVPLVVWALPTTEVWLDCPSSSKLKVWGTPIPGLLDEPLNEHTTSIQLTTLTQQNIQSWETAAAGAAYPHVIWVQGVRDGDRIVTGEFDLSLRLNYDGLQCVETKKVAVIGKDPSLQVVGDDYKGFLFPDGGDSVRLRAPFGWSDCQVTWGFATDSLGATIVPDEDDDRFAVLTAGTEMGSVVVQAQLADTSRCGGCKATLEVDISCSPPAKKIGQATIKSGSVHFEVGLGTANGGATAGVLRLHSDTLSEDLATPDRLGVTVLRNDVQPLHDPTTGVLRQVKAPQGLADIEAFSGGYDIHIHRDVDVSSWAIDSSDQTYITTGLVPYVTWRVENPDDPFDERLQISEIRYNGSGQEETRATHIFTYSDIGDDPNYATWTLAVKEGDTVLRSETSEWALLSADRWSREHVILEDDVVVHAATEVWEAIDGARVLMSQSFYPDGLGTTPLVTTYERFGSTTGTYANNPLWKGRPEWVEHADGSWEWHDYDIDVGGWDLEKTHTVYRPFGNTPRPSACPTAPTQLGISATETYYHELKTGPLYRSCIITTITRQYVNGLLVSKQEQIKSAQLNDVDDPEYYGVTEISRQYIRPGGTQVGDYLETITDYGTAPYDFDLDEPWQLAIQTAREPQVVYHPDGQQDTYQRDTGSFDPVSLIFTPGDGGFERTTTEYRPANGQATRDVTVMDAFGRTVYQAIQVEDGGNWATIDLGVTTIDDATNTATKLRLDPSNPAHVLSSHTADDGCRSCGGSGSATDEEETTNQDGITTAYMRDALGRIVRMIRSGAAGHSTYDDQPDVVTCYEYTSFNDNGVIRPMQRVKVGTEADCLTPVSVTETVSDAAGRVVRESRVTADTEVADLATAYSYGNAPAGGAIVTVVAPDGRTTVTTYRRDGRRDSITGDGQVPSYFEYAVEPISGINYTKTSTYAGTRAGPNRLARTTLSDALGRIYEERRPAYPSGEVIVRHAYYAPSANPDVSAGRPSSVEHINSEVTAVTLYEYEQSPTGLITRTGQDMDGNGALDKASEDRISESVSGYVFTEGDWWRSTRNCQYEYTSAGAPDSAPTLINETRDRLTGFGNTAGLTDRSEQVMIDSFGNSSRTVKSYDPASPVVRTTSYVPGATNAIVGVTYNGKEVERTGLHGGTTRFTYDEIGRRQSHSDARTQQKTFTEYNDYGVAAVFTTADNTLSGSRLTDTLTVYDAVTGRVAKVGKKLIEDGSATYKWTYFDYDTSTPGQPLYRVWGDNVQPQEFGFDALGQRTTLKTYRGTDLDFTSVNWPSGSDDPNHVSTTSWIHDPDTGLLSSKTYPDGESVTHTYWPDGRLWTRTWARGEVTTYAYHTTGELHTVDYAATTGTDYTYLYDRIGRTISVADGAGGSNHVFEYDDWPAEVREIVSGGPFGTPYTIKHTNAPASGGLMTDLTVATGSTIYDADYQYEPATRRLLNVNGPGLRTPGVTMNGITYQYAPDSDLVAGLYLSNGDDDRVQHTVRTFDPDSAHLASVANWWIADTAESVSTYAYTTDNLGRRRTLANSGSALPRQEYTRWAYNDRSELTDSDRYVGDDPNEYGTDQPVLKRVFDFTYDTIGNRVGHSQADPGASSPQFSYNSNENNQYLAINKTIQPNPATQILRYDDDGNLTEIGVGGDMDCDGDVDFDDVNCFSPAIGKCPGSLPPTYLCPNCDCLRGDVDGDGDVDFDDITPFLNAIGAVPLSPWMSLTWDSENRLIAVQPHADALQANDTRVVYGYDYRGRRISRAVEVYDGTSTWTEDTSQRLNYLWDGWLLLMEIDASGNILRQYTWGLDLAGLNGQVNSLQHAGAIGGLIGIKDAHNLDAAGDNPLTMDNYASYYVNYDGNGNVAQIVAFAPDYGSASGYAWNADRLVARYEYDPYGNVVGPDGDGDGTLDDAGTYAATNTWRFSTKQFDEQTGFGCWGFRWYNPLHGRWLSRDPIEELGGVNLYSYVHNQVDSSADALGLAACCGLDVTDALKTALAGIEDTFDNLPIWERRDVCTSMYDGEGWDIVPFHLVGHPSSTGQLPRTFTKHGCGEVNGMCRGTVTLHDENGKSGCYWAGELNYVLWGAMNRRCYREFNLGFGDWSYTHFQAARAVQAHRIWKYWRRVFRDDNPYDRIKDGLGIARRLMWTGAGWTDNWKTAFQHAAEPACAPCGATYTGTLVIQVGRKDPSGSGHQIIWPSP
jgi:RHS repeat-associated protein